MFLKEKLLLVFFKKKFQSTFVQWDLQIWLNMILWITPYINYWIIDKTCKIYLTFYYYQLFDNYIGGFDRSKY